MKLLRHWEAGSPRDRQNLQACKAAIHSVLPHAQIVLFGSRARGVAGPESDFDLLVIDPSPVSTDIRKRLSDALYDVELDREIVVSCVVCSREQWDASPWRAAPLRANVEREGIAV
jgi:predicted nucleotidyltransferase